MTTTETNLFWPENVSKHWKYTAKSEGRGGGKKYIGNNSQKGEGAVSDKCCFSFLIYFGIFYVFSLFSGKPSSFPRGRFTISPPSPPPGIFRLCFPNHFPPPFPDMILLIETEAGVKEREEEEEKAKLHHRCSYNCTRGVAEIRENGSGFFLIPTWERRKTQVFVLGTFAKHT